MAAGIAILLALASGPALATTGLPGLKSIYQARLDTIIRESGEKRMALRTDYVRALRELEAAFRKAGKLERVLDVQREKERFQDSYTLPACPGKDTPAEIIALQKRCREAWHSTQRSKHRRVMTLVRYYTRHLAALEKKLTVQGKIEQALEVRSEKEATRKSPEVRAAKFALSDRPAKRKSRPSERGTAGADAVVARQDLLRSAPAPSTQG
jgi:hypothetical protein